MPYLLFAILFVLLLLFMRFVQPELIYSFRQILVKIGMNKVYLDQDAGRSDLSARYQELLIKDLRFETVGYDSSYALKRINKIRELYSTLDWHRSEDFSINKERRPQVCILELVSLLKNLGEHIRPQRDYDYPTVKADAILKLIANEIRLIQSSRQNDQSGEPLKLGSDKEVEEWFMENPMSIEQTIEVLIAAVFGLAYRQKIVEVYESRKEGGNILRTK